MTFEDYSFIRKWQESNITSEMIDAIKTQNQLHMLVQEKMNLFYDLQDKYVVIFKKGLDKLFAKHPEIREWLPDEEKTYVERIGELVDGVENPNSDIKKITVLMKSIDELVESEKMNEDIGQACLEFFLALSKLDDQISEDRKRFFTDEYLNKMDSLAEDGVFMYFLETPDFPLLDDRCDSNYILDSLIFADYISSETLLFSTMCIENPGKSMTTKQEDIAAAFYNMRSGFQRTAARNWFSLLESEHKKCANIFEGFWDKAREFKKGAQRSKKITELLDKTFDAEWEQRAWNKIDAYYQQMTGKETEGVVNRNIIIHGDYNNGAIDITDRDVVRIMLMWINLRLIADKMSFIEEFYQNKVTMIPYFCKLFPAD